MHIVLLIAWLIAMYRQYETTLSYLIFTKYIREETMQIWVDADACPKPIKEILFRAAERKGIMVTLVANQFLSTPPSKLIKSVQVESGFDVADNYIVSKMQAGDLVITQDIPLAAEVIDKQGLAIHPRGELYSPENIRQRLSMRDFMETLRSAGVETGGPAAFSQSDKQQFANQLDRILAKNSK